MKTKFFLVVFYLFCALNAMAQSDYSNYLNKALEKLEANDCVSARKAYNLYKELSGKSVSSLEVLLNDCESAAGSGVKKYKLNEKIKIEEYWYRVAYIEDDGAHGFAIYDYGGGVITQDLIKKRMLPTRSEMAIIYSNRSALRLANSEYWTMDAAEQNQYYYHSFGSNALGRGNPSNPRGIILIYRF